MSWGDTFKGLLDSVRLGSGGLDAQGNDITDVGKNTGTDLQYGSVDTDELNHKLSNATNVVGSRALGTEYQNTTGHVIYVTVHLTNDSGSSGLIGSDFRVANSSGMSGGDTMDFVSISVDSGDDISIGGIVPDGAYYKAENFSNDMSLKNWYERDYQ